MVAPTVPAPMMATVDVCLDMVRKPAGGGGDLDFGDRKGEHSKRGRVKDKGVGVQ